MAQQQQTCFLYLTYMLLMLLYKGLSLISSIMSDYNSVKGFHIAQLSMWGGQNDTEIWIAAFGSHRCRSLPPWLHVTQHRSQLSVDWVMHYRGKYSCLTCWIWPNLCTFVCVCMCLCFHSHSPSLCVCEVTTTYCVRPFLVVITRHFFHMLRPLWPCL